MKKLLSALLAVAAMTSFAARAEDTEKYYGGLTLTTPGKASALSRTGERVSDNSRVGAKTYGGINVNQHFALEAGYGDFGSNTLKNTGAGASGDARIAADMLYLAAKGSYPANERFALFGKAGIAHTRIALTGFGEPDAKMTHTMLGLGAQYQVAPTVALTLELNRYGAMRTATNKKFELNKLEAGVKFGF